MGTDNGESIQHGYNFEILNTFEMGHLKKSCSHIPSRMDPSQTPGDVGHRIPMSQSSFGLVLIGGSGLNPLGLLTPHWIIQLVNDRIAIENL